MNLRLLSYVLVAGLLVASAAHAQLSPDKAALEDSKGMGKADKAITFYQSPELLAPLGIAVAAEPNRDHTSSFKKDKAPENPSTHVWKQLK